MLKPFRQGGACYICMPQKQHSDQIFTFNQTQISKAETSRITSEIRFRGFRGERPEFPPADTYSYARPSVSGVVWPPLHAAPAPTPNVHNMSVAKSPEIFCLRRSKFKMSLGFNLSVPKIISGDLKQAFFLNKKRLNASSLNRAKTKYIDLGGSHNN